MNQQQIENLKKSMTVSVFAALPTAWPEYVIYGGTVVARIHPNCNRWFDNGIERVPEQDVITRALVYMPNDDVHQPFGMTGLRRLTVRERNLEFNPEDIKEYLAGVADAHMLPKWQEIRNNYWRCLEEILALPLTDLSDPMRGQDGSR